MGTKAMKFSDLSGQLLPEGDEPIRLVVLEHPGLTNGPVQLEAVPHEVAPAVDAALNVAIFELHLPGDESPRRVVVDVGDFDALATDKPMPELLKQAPAVKPAKGAVKATAVRGSNYAALELAGTPHRGKVTAEEARLVREHLPEVNARLARDGLRQIDPNNQADAERYGFTLPTAPEMGPELEQF